MNREFRILGPLEARVDGVVTPLGGTRQRAVLAILLLHRGEAVSVDRIVDELWGERPPETATKTIQVYVSRLRKTLGEGVVVTRGGGYAIDPTSATVDADRFERLANEGQEALDRGEPQLAAERLAEALALWRGEPLADLAYEEFAQREIARLDETRLTCLEGRIEADLALGRHGPLVAELETLVAAHPERERFRAQLMLALYRSGRQGDALASYQEGRRALLERGLEPSPALRELETAIIAQDSALAAPPRGAASAVLREHRLGGLLIAAGSLLALGAVAAILLTSLGGDDGVTAEPNSLAVIDPASDTVTETVPTGVQPTEVSGDAESVWVANRSDDTITQVSIEDRRVVATATPDMAVTGMAAAEQGVWVTNGQRSLARLDPGFRSVDRTVRLPRPDPLAGLDSNAIAVGEGGVWLARISGEVARVDEDTAKLTASIPVGNDPRAIAIGEGGVWVADAEDSTVSRIDPREPYTVTTTVPVGRSPSAIAAGEGAVWVANTLDDTVTRIDPRSGAAMATIEVGQRPTGIAAAEGAVWVANSLDGTVSRIDPGENAIEATIEVGEAPQSVTVAGGSVWVSVQERDAPPPPSSAGPEDLARIILPDDPGPTDPAVDLDTQRAAATCLRLYQYPDEPFPQGSRLEPEAAGEGSTVSDDGLTWRFEIVPGHRFSPPSNEPVTAAAFARAIERVLHPRTGSYALGLLNEIVGAPAYTSGKSSRLRGVRVDGDDLVIELTRPAPDLPARLAATWFCAVPPETPISSQGIDELPSAGPYYVASHVPERSLVLRQNPNYGGSRERVLEEIRYEIGISSERAIEEVEAGRADYVVADPLVASGLQPDAIRALTERYGPDSQAAAAGDQRIFSQPTLSSHFYAFNTVRGPFRSVRLRRAVNFAMDRSALAADTGFGEPGRPADQLVAPGVPGFEDVQIYPLGAPDLMRARELVGDRRLGAVLYTCNLPGCARQAEILRSNLERIGIALDVRRFPLEQLFDRTANPDEPFDIGFGNWFADYADPSNFIGLFGSEGYLAPLTEDPELKRQIAAAESATGDERLAAYAAADRYIAEQALIAAYASGKITHFLSTRMGCEVLHPVNGLLLNTLCVEEEG